MTGIQATKTSRDLELACFSLSCPPNSTGSLQWECQFGRACHSENSSGCYHPNAFLETLSNLGSAWKVVGSVKGVGLYSGAFLYVWLTRRHEVPLGFRHISSTSSTYREFCHTFHSSSANFRVIVSSVPLRDLFIFFILWPLSFHDWWHMGDFCSHSTAVTFNGTVQNSFCSKCCKSLFDMEIVFWPSHPVPDGILSSMHVQETQKILSLPLCLSPPSLTQNTRPGGGWSCAPWQVARWGGEEPSCQETGSGTEWKGMGRWGGSCLLRSSIWLSP